MRWPDMDDHDDFTARRAAHIARQMWAKLDEIDLAGIIEDGDALDDNDRKFLASCNIKWEYNPEEHDDETND